MGFFYSNMLCSKTLILKLKTPKFAAPFSSLIGPPELKTFAYQQKNKSLDDKEAIKNPFMDLMVSKYNNTQLPYSLHPYSMSYPYPQFSGSLYPQMGYTENRSPTYLLSGNPCLDFFFHVVPDTPSDSVQKRLSEAWNHDSLTSLKLVCNLRGVKGTGKSDKEGFYAAALWLYEHHPETLAFNTPTMAKFGYFKDLPEILYRIVEGSDVRKNQLIEKEEKNNLYEHNRKMKMTGHGGRWKNLKDAVTKEQARLDREEKRLKLAKKALERYENDPVYRSLFERVSEYFGECLKADLEHLKNNETNKVSLAAKWCPSLFSQLDVATLLCEGIARKIFPRESYPEYEGIEEEHYAYRIRDRLRKEVLAPLRKALELPELYMSLKKWDELPYNRVSSLAMKLYKKRFMQHDQERFTEYLGKVKSGKAKIAAGALLPHQIIHSLKEENGGEVAELQWKRTVDDLLREGKLTNCLAISDVSGSMHGEPLEVSVALGLLVSELSEQPWKGKLITFSKNPTLQIVKGDTLLEKINSIERMQWNVNTDFQKVFDVMLEVAVNGKLKEDEMIKRVFVFSDMEFDVASLRPWETDYEAIVKKFTEKGYGNAIPQIVFWNLRDSRATPVPCGQKGVALVSGFSKNLLKLFMDGNGDIDPVPFMEAAIAGEEYQTLCC
ncbi:hypothetical protein M5689_008585 [Euphorbia peplus]|nr:hypothetical protein M5689_008585 [Euphorbia peplus]